MISQQGLIAAAHNRSQRNGGAEFPLGVQRQKVERLTLVIQNYSKWLLVEIAKKNIRTEQEFLQQLNALQNHKLIPTLRSVLKRYGLNDVTEWREIAAAYYQSMAQALKEYVQSKKPSLTHIIVWMVFTQENEQFRCFLTECQLAPRRSSAAGIFNPDLVAESALQPVNDITPMEIAELIPKFAIWPDVPVYFPQPKEEGKDAFLLRGLVMLLRDVGSFKNNYPWLLLIKQQITSLTQDEIRQLLPACIREHGVIARRVREHDLLVYGWDDPLVYGWFEDVLNNIEEDLSDDLSFQILYSFLHEVALWSKNPNSKLLKMMSHLTVLDRCRLLKKYFDHLINARTKGAVRLPLCNGHMPEDVSAFIEECLDAVVGPLASELDRDDRLYMLEYLEEHNWNLSEKSSTRAAIYQGLFDDVDQLTTWIPRIHFSAKKCLNQFARIWPQKNRAQLVGVLFENTFCLSVLKETDLFPELVQTLSELSQDDVIVCIQKAAANMLGQLNELIKSAKIDFKDIKHKIICLQLGVTVESILENTDFTIDQIIEVLSDLKSNYARANLLSKLQRDISVLCLPNSDVMIAETRASLYAMIRQSAKTCDAAFWDVMLPALNKPGAVLTLLEVAHADDFSGMKKNQVLLLSILAYPPTQQLLFNAVQKKLNVRNIKWLFTHLDRTIICKWIKQSAEMRAIIRESADLTKDAVVGNYDEKFTKSLINSSQICNPSEWCIILCSLDVNSPLRGLALTKLSEFVFRLSSMELVTAILDRNAEDLFFILEKRLNNVDSMTCFADKLIQKDPATRMALLRRFAEYPVFRRLAFEYWPVNSILRMLAGHAYKEVADLVKLYLIPALLQHPEEVRSNATLKNLFTQFPNATIFSAVIGNEVLRRAVNVEVLVLILTQPHQDAQFIQQIEKQEEVIQDLANYQRFSLLEWEQLLNHRAITQPVISLSLARALLNAVLVTGATKQLSEIYNRQTPQAQLWLMIAILDYSGLENKNNEQYDFQKFLNKYLTEKKSLELYPLHIMSMRAFNALFQFACTKEWVKIKNEYLLQVMLSLLDAPYDKLRIVYEYTNDSVVEIFNYLVELQNQEKRDQLLTTYTCTAIVSGGIEKIALASSASPREIVLKHLAKITHTCTTLAEPDYERESVLLESYGVLLASRIATHRFIKYGEMQKWLTAIAVETVQWPIEVKTNSASDLFLLLKPAKGSAKAAYYFDLLQNCPNVNLAIAAEIMRVLIEDYHMGNTLEELLEYVINVDDDEALQQTKGCLLARAKYAYHVMSQSVSDVVVLRNREQFDLFKKLAGGLNLHAKQQYPLFPQWDYQYGQFVFAPRAWINPLLHLKGELDEQQKALRAQGWIILDEEMLALSPDGQTQLIPGIHFNDVVVHEKNGLLSHPRGPF